MPKKLDDSVVAEKEKFLLYGDPGTGKTFAAGTMPEPIYFLVVGGENELKTLRSPDFLNKHGERDISYDNVLEQLGERGQFEEAVAFDVACDLLDDALEARRKGDFPFASLVVDNATTLQEVQMNKALEVNAEFARSTHKSTLEKKLRDHNILIPADNDYMSQMSLMDQFVNWLFKLDVHVCMVAHEWTQTDFDRSTRTTTVISRRPLFTGKHRTRIPRAFDNVWWMSVAGGDRGRYYRCQTIGDDKVLAKTRFGGVVPPTMTMGLSFEKVIEQFREETRKRKASDS